MFYTFIFAVLLLKYCRWVRGSPEQEGRKSANARLTRRPGVSVTLQRSQGGVTQLTRYAIVDVYTGWSS